ncbi:hypothetical protein SGPA1_30221 [Streptomyces misionensis JCM 4497]
MARQQRVFRHAAWERSHGVTGALSPVA